MPDFTLRVEDLEVAFRARGAPRRLEVPQFPYGGTHVRGGALFLITGESGCGKSTFLNALLGLLPESAVRRGRFLLGEAGGAEEALTYRQYRRRRFLDEQVSVVFQDAVGSLHPFRPVDDQCPSAREPEEMKRWKELNLSPEHLAGRLPADCSGGECQRLSLLFPYCDRQRDLVLLDEPLTDIDWISHKRVLEAIELILGQESGDGIGSGSGAARRAVILVSHRWKQWIRTHESLRDIPRYEVRDGRLGLAREEDGSGGGEPADSPGRSPGHSGGARPSAVAGSGDRAAPALRVEVRNLLLGEGASAFKIMNLELEVPQGEGVALIGESGCGKSTVLKVAAGLRPRREYCRGSELRDGRPARSEDAKTRLAVTLGEYGLLDLSGGRKGRARRLQLAQQNVAGTLFAQESVGGALEHLRRLRGVDRAQFDGWVGEWSAGLGLSLGADDRRKSLAQLSVGMQRRFNLLRAFLLLAGANEGERQLPKVLLLDEVSRGLDDDNVDRMAKALESFRRNQNASFVIVSHDLHFLQRCSEEFTLSARLMLRGVLLPEPLSGSDLERAPGSIRPELSALPNPYYGEFLGQREPVRRGNPDPVDAGCVYRRYFTCENEGKPGCRHPELRNEGVVGICS